MPRTLAGARTKLSGQPFTPTVNALNAISFNGTTQYGKILNSAAIDNLNGSSVTIEMWVYRNGNQTSSAQLGRIAASTFQMYTDGTNYATIVGVTDYSGNDSYRFADTSCLTSVTWTHIAFVFNASSKVVTIYKNGAVYSGSVASQTGSGTMVTPAGGDLYMGTHTTAGIPYKGSFANFRVWNTARSAAQIAAEYLNYLDPSQETGLVINCPIIEGSGTTVANNVSGGNNMSLVATPTWVAGPQLFVKNYSARNLAAARSVAAARTVVS